MKRYRSVKLDTDVEEIGLEDEIDFGEDFDVDAVDTAAAAEALIGLEVSSLPTDEAKKLYNTVAEATMKPAANEFYNNGTKAYGKADYSSAAESFVNAFKCDSTKAEAAYYAAKCYVALNQPENAKKYYQYIVEGFRSSSYYSEADAYLKAH